MNIDANSYIVYTVAGENTKFVTFNSTNFFSIETSTARIGSYNLRIPARKNTQVKVINDNSFMISVDIIES